MLGGDESNSKEPAHHRAPAWPEYGQDPEGWTGRFRGVWLLGWGSYRAQDVLSQKDSWPGVEAKNAKSSLLLSLLAVGGRAGSQESLSWVLEPPHCVPWTRKQPVSEPQLQSRAGTWIRDFSCDLGWGGVNLPPAPTRHLSH